MVRVKHQIVIISIILGLFSGLAISSVNAQVSGIAPTPSEKQREMPPGRGFVPPRMDLSHLTGQRMPLRYVALQAPAQWDWRAQGKVTPVKNQGACGSCYAFASLANLESKLLVDGGGALDLSENNAKECNWHGTSCSGGSYYEMANWFSQKGVVLESCDPYVPSDVSCNSTCPYVKTLLDWRIISGNNIPATTVLQNYIYTNGPVYTTLYAGDGNDPAWSSEFNTYDGSYTLYYDGPYDPNHAVLIVGWDDALVHAGGTGAWIVKNSWGTGWGGTCGYGSEGGYFTIAYESAKIGMWSSYIDDWQDYNEHNEVMYYDEAGNTNSWGAGGSTAWGLCRFVPSSKVFITRVDFWTSDATIDVDVYIYDDFDGSSLGSLLASQLDTSYDEAGYHSIPLDSPPEITAGNDIYAVVRFTNQSYPYPVPLDGAGPSAPGATYVSGTGGSGSWSQMSGYDVAIRIRTAPTLSASVDDMEELSPDSYTLSHNYPNPFNPSTTINYTLQRRAHVNITIYNLLGQRINTIVEEVKAAGEHTTRWDGKDYDGKPVATGIYLYRIKAGDFSESKKMLLLK